MSNNKVKFGLRNVKYSKITIGEEGKYVYATPVSIPGAVNLSLSPSGETNNMNADDVVYFSASSNQGYEGDLEIALIPESFLIDILGFTKDSNGALIENADALASPFALGFEVQGDKKPRRTWLYNCSATRSPQNAATKESSVSPTTETLSIKAMPRENDKNVKVTLELDDTNKTAYDSFFTTVYENTESV